MGSVEAAKEIGGINLEDYFLQKRTFTSAVYVHKKFLNTDQKFVDPKVNKTEKKKSKEEKGRQCDGLQNTNIIFKDDKTYKVLSRNDSVLDQTIKFAKNLIPLVIPPSRDKSPTQVYYTIKPTKISKKKTKQSQEGGKEYNNNVKRSKTKITETFKKKNKQSISIKESTTFSSSNTLNDINNQSLSYTISETPEKKKKATKKGTDTQKCTVSESFEALATELNGDKIKIHLMTAKDKNMLTDTLTIPILHAVKECISDFNAADKKTDRLVQANSKKLEEIMYKLNTIETKLDACTKMLSSSTETIKTSRLEQLGEDLIQDNNSEEEISREFNREGDTVVHFMNESEKKFEDLACGEVPPAKATKSVGVKANRPARLPTRFCWTDATRNN